MVVLPDPPFGLSSMMVCTVLPLWAKIVPDKQPVPVPANELLYCFAFLILPFQFCLRSPPNRGATVHDPAEAEL